MRFLIQGPYNVNPNRENIKANDKWNQEVIDETAILVSDSISKMKSLGLLDASFLCALPLDTEYFKQEKTEFRSIYERVKEKLFSDEALLPADDGGFVARMQAFVGGGKDLRLLLRNEQLDYLFKRKGSKWLNESITESKEPDLWNYLTKELGIETVDAERFARQFDEGFISKQTDQWVSSFYAFLMDHEGLWKRGYSWERPGPLHSKHIIRLNDNSHIAPFDEDGKPQAYLPHKNPEINKLFTRTVKDTIAWDKKAREFLRVLGLKEPDEVAIFLRVILPLYKQATGVSEKDNILHVGSILKILESCESSRRDEFVRELRETPFLFATDASSQQKAYKKPTEIHFGGEYTRSSILDIYFEGSKEAWFLDEQYLSLEDRKRMLEKFEQLGCKSRIQVNYTKPDVLNYVWLTDQRMRYSRGVNGFDPNCEIEGLEYALENINIERARILWNIAIEHHQKVHGLVQSSNKKNFSDSCDWYRFSKMGQLLEDHQWLPNSKSTSFLKPSDLFLSELPEGFDKESIQARDLSKKLNFKPELDEELQEAVAKAPDELKEIVEELMSIPPEKRKQAKERALQAIRSSEVELQGPAESETPTKTLVSPTPDELMDEFLRYPVQEQSSSAEAENKTWKGPTPEELERLQEYEEEVMSELSKRSQVIERKPKK